MSNVTSFIIPLDLQKKLDDYWKEHACKSRSQALREIMNYYFEREGKTNDRSI